jgi:hypothetical protein
MTPDEALVMGEGDGVRSEFAKFCAMANSSESHKSFMAAILGRVSGVSLPDCQGSQSEKVALPGTFWHAPTLAPK